MTKIRRLTVLDGGRVRGIQLSHSAGRGPGDCLRKGMRVLPGMTVGALGGVCSG